MVVVAPKDVLPTVDIPVVVVVWTYNGLSTSEMERRITTYAEFSLSNNVNNIRRMESTTLQGTAVQKIYFDDEVSVTLPFVSVQEIHDGKFTLWRDYSNMNTLEKSELRFAGTSDSSQIGAH